MKRLALLCLLLLTTVACSKHKSAPQLVVEIPAGFSGNFVLNMGVRDAAALPQHGDAYVVSVNRAGNLETSTLLESPKVTFRNASGGNVWGFSQSDFSTGDGIPVGGKIEFFVGTQKEFEAEQDKKNHSSGFTGGYESAVAGA